MKFPLILGLIAFTALAALPARGHHSFAMYEKKSVTLTGQVKSFQWTNPHCVVWFVVKPDNGDNPQEWGIETTSPGVLTRSGWTRNSIKPGDHVAIEFNPLRDGSHGGGLDSVTLLDTGQKLTVSFTNPTDEK